MKGSAILACSVELAEEEEFARSLPAVGIINCKPPGPIRLPAHYLHTLPPARERLALRIRAGDAPRRAGQRQVAIPIEQRRDRLAELGLEREVTPGDLANRGLARNDFAGVQDKGGMGLVQRHRGVE